MSAAIFDVIYLKGTPATRRGRSCVRYEEISETSVNKNVHKWKISEWRSTKYYLIHIDVLDVLWFRFVLLFSFFFKSYLMRTRLRMRPRLGAYSKRLLCTDVRKELRCVFAPVWCRGDVVTHSDHLKGVFLFLFVVFRFEMAVVLKRTRCLRKAFLTHA